MSSSRIIEANKRIEEGEKYLKTGFFKWRADYDSAAPCFDKAAIAYKNDKNFKRACELYLKTADCHYKNGSRFHAGKAYEEAGMVCKELKKFDEFAGHFDHASNLYLEDGTPDTAALCLLRGGKILESIEPSWALELFTKAAAIYENENDGRLRAAAEVTGRISRLLTKMNKYDEAIASINKEKNLYSRVEGGDHGASGRLVCAQVLLCLQIGDQVRAESMISDGTANISGFAASEEYHILQELIGAFEDRNQEKARLILKMPLFKYMDAVYARLTRTLKVVGHSTAQEVAGDNGKLAAVNASNNEEDDDLL